LRGANKSSYISKARTIKILLKIKFFKLALIKNLIYIYKSVRVVLAVAPTNQKYHSAVSLEVSRFSHPVGTIRVSRGRDSCCWWTFFPLSIHSSPMKIIALPFLLLVFKFNFFFISNFFSLRFFRSFIDFQFHHSIQIYGIMFFNLILIILISNFSLALKFYLFSILSFNPNLWYIIFTNFVLILFYFFSFFKSFFLFNFTLQSKNYY